MSVINSSKCRPLPALAGPTPGVYLVELTREANLSEVAGQLTALGLVFRGFRSLPLLEIQASDERRDQLRNIPGVKAIHSAPAGHEVKLRIALGIDWLAWLGERQQSGQAAGLVGGRVAGSGDFFPSYVADGTRLELTIDTSTDLPIEPALMPIINMSVGTWPVNYPFLDNDPVNLATRAVAAVGRQLIVMSAGNCGLSTQSVETMSAWAEAKWVLSVGATEDESGHVLAAYSGRGSRQQPHVGPDVVAWGRSKVAPHPAGTSFAAPRVAGYGLICAAALLELRHALQSAVGPPEAGVRLVGVGMIDEFGDEIWGARLERGDFTPSGQTAGVLAPRLDTPGLPIVGTQPDQIRQLSQLIQTHGLTVNVRGSAEILRGMLLAAARPMPTYAPFEVGHGFLSDEVVLDFLARLNGAHVLKLFAGEVAPHDVLAQASRCALFDRAALVHLARFVYATAPHWRYDWRSQRFGFRLSQWEAEQDWMSTQLSPDERALGRAVSWPLITHA